MSRQGSARVLLPQMLASDPAARKPVLRTHEIPFARLRERLRLPLIAAPMFLVSGVDLVAAACRSGVVGAFPTANCRTPEELAHWFAAIGRNLRAHEDATGSAAAPVCPI